MDWPIEPIGNELSARVLKRINSIALRQDVLRVRIGGEFTSDTAFLCKLEQLFGWTSDQQWTSYSLNPTEPPAVDITAEVARDLVYHLAPLQRLELQSRTIDLSGAPVPISLRIPALLPTREQPVARALRGVKVNLTAVGEFDPPLPGTIGGEPRSSHPVSGTWTSSNPDVARILNPKSSTAIVETVSPGVAVLTCRHRSGLSTQGLLQVVPPSIESVTVTIDEPISDPLIGPDRADSFQLDGPPGIVPPDPFTGPLAPGTVVQLKATARWSDGSVRDVTNSAAWSIEQNGVASLEGSTLRAEFPGTVLVTATLNPDGPTVVPIVRPRISGGTELTVKYPPGSNISLIPRGQQIQLGSTVAYRAFARLLDGATREITSQTSFSSSDASIASIRADGLATGLAAGRAHIRGEFGGADAAVDLFVAAPLTALSIEPPAPPVSQGASPAYRATGTYADGSSRDVTALVRWSSANPEILSVGAGGVGSARAAGTAVVNANLDGISANVETTVLGPSRLVVTAQPSPANPAPGSPFSLTVEVWDARGRVPAADSEITLEVAPGTSGILTGQLIRTAQNGVAVFDNLQLDRAGTGFVLLATSAGLTSAQTQPFNVGAASVAVGHLFVANDNAPVGAVNSLAVDSNGVPTAVGGSPFTTSGRSHAIERLSDLVVTADSVVPAGPSRLSIFRYDAATGVLTPTAGSPSASFSLNFNPLHTTGNRVNALFVLAEFDANVHAIRLDPSTGNVLSTNTVPISGGSQPNELVFRASTGGGPDLLFVLQGNGGGNNVHAFSYDNATGLLTPGPVTPIGVGVLPGGVAVIGGRLYVTNQGPGPDSITVFTINQATGALAFVGTVSSGSDGSEALYHLAHPVVGDMLFCANPADSTISVFTIDGAGQPVPLGLPVPVGSPNPHQFADLNLGGGRFALYLTASTQLTGFLVDPVTGVLTALSTSPFSGFNSPFGITR